MNETTQIPTSTYGKIVVGSYTTKKNYIFILKETEKFLFVEKSINNYLIKPDLINFLSSAFLFSLHLNKRALGLALRGLSN